MMVREAVVVSVTHGRLYLLTHCKLGCTVVKYFDEISRPNTIHPLDKNG